MSFQSPAINAPIFQKRLLKWFDQYGRNHLPWQQNRNPYKVWLSEIMLQQTQVKTVIPYFERFIQRFPDLHTLANAHLDDVLHFWSGLGYYSRARNLVQAAREILKKFNGQFPHHLDEMIQLPGIGRSTAGAILAQAFNQRAVILDGNVKRVLIRFCGIEETPNGKLEKKLWDIAEYYTPQKNIQSYTQAMMDLGALVCTPKKPDCPHCPLRFGCAAFRFELTELLPRKKNRKKLPVRTATFLLFQDDKKILLIKRPQKGIWAGLWSLPEILGRANQKMITDYCQNNFALTIRRFEKLNPFRHTFTHFHLDIFPIRIHTTKTLLRIKTKAEQIWYNRRKPAIIGLPKPVKILIDAL